jgi:hypothetical protein
MQVAKNADNAAQQLKLSGKRSLLLTVICSRTELWNKLKEAANLNGVRQRRWLTLKLS